MKGCPKIEKILAAIEVTYWNDDDDPRLRKTYQDV
jgi:hypothetical protein